MLTVELVARRVLDAERRPRSRQIKGQLIQHAARRLKMKPERLQRKVQELIDEWRTTRD